LLLGDFQTNFELNDTSVNFSFAADPPPQKSKKPVKNQPFTTLDLIL